MMYNNLICVCGYVLFMCVLTATAIENTQPYRYDYVYVRKIKGWLKIHPVPATWHEARKTCNREGAVLASPLNDHLALAMRNLIVSSAVPNCAIYTGVHAMFSSAHYQSIEGVPIDRMPVIWPTESGQKRGSCVLLYDDLTFSSVNCTESYPYMCYKKMKPGDTLTTPCGTTDKDYNLDQRTGSCYKFHRIGTSWPEAFATCAAEGAHLAIVDNTDEVEVMKDLFVKNPNETVTSPYPYVALIGYLDWEKNRQWTTIHGEPLKYEVWNTGEPNNVPPGEYCGSIVWNGYLNDVPCDLLLAFICEKRPNSLLEDNY